MPSLVEANTSLSSAAESTPIVNRYRCGEPLPEFVSLNKPMGPNGFFRFGSNVICYGQTSGTTSPVVNAALFNASELVKQEKLCVALPFDAAQIVNNLRYERYVEHSGWQDRVQESWVRDLYYTLRPMFPVVLRKQLQRIYLGNWNSIQFPSWPVDRTADIMIEKLLVVAMQTLGIHRLPFIWFWPSGYRSCAIVTHDVETTLGRDFCGSLMDINDEFAIKSSFQIVPEKRYAVTADYLNSLRARGFEVNIHGLNHDGNLFRDRHTFLEKAQKINEYAREYGASGFRSPVLYRNIDWFQDLHFSYDMTVPNVGRLEAQRGGCCTVMPYFLPGNITELPLTTTEDYTLFHILNDYSTTLWKNQIDIIIRANGLMTFLIHPDYITKRRAHDTYRRLLEELNRLRSDEGVWIPLPREVDKWWREREAMRLVRNGEEWKIEGAGCERAAVAYACLRGDQLTYEF